MSVSPIKLETVPVIDPEIVNPRADNMYDNRHLSRFAKCSRIPGAKIGCRTYDAMLASMAEYYQEWNDDANVSKRDFINASSAFARYGILHCGDFDFSEIVDNYGYNSYLGDAANALILRDDLAGIDASDILLVSDVMCWDESIQDGDALSDAVVIIGDWEHGRLECSIGSARRKWLREKIAIHNEEPSYLREYAREAFPELVFADNAFSSLGRLEHSYRENAPIIVRHLSVLNDRALEIRDSLRDERKIDACMDALGVESSGERGKTKRDSEAMRERTALFDGVPIVCEWHTKLHRNVDRIHFCIRDDKVHIGLFVDHCKL